MIYLHSQIYWNMRSKESAHVFPHNITADHTCTCILVSTVRQPPINKSVYAVRLLGLFPMHSLKIMTYSHLKLQRIDDKMNKLLDELILHYP